MNRNFIELPPTQVDPIVLANAQWPEFMARYDDPINTTIGVLLDPRTNAPWRPASVERALITAQEDINSIKLYGYQTQVGHAAFLKAAGEFVFGEEIVSEHGLLSYQSLGGTNTLNLVRDTLEQLMKQGQHGIQIFTDAGWPNHRAIFNAPFERVEYTHLNPDTRDYFHEAALDTAKVAKAPVMLLQVCGYNDDGADRTNEQWDDMVEVAKQNNAVVILDSAYLGLANGLAQDRYAIQQFVDCGLLTFVCFSGSKNMGLYNERLGAVFIANAHQQLGPQQAANLDNVVRRVVRRTISSAPFHVAQAALSVLTDPAYYIELEVARGRLNGNRQILASQISDAFPAVATGRGLFTKLLADGFTSEQRKALTEQGILTLPNSRINIGGMTAGQTERVGAAIMQLF